METYRIKAGDNIWKLCNEIFEVPFWLVSKYNPNLDFYSLKLSEVLVVPVIQERGGN